MLSEKQLVEIVDAAIKRFRGNSARLSNAIGYLFIGRRFGWRVALLMHDRKSVKDYEQILGIDSREIFPEIGQLAEKSVAYWALKKVTNFWKAVRGEIPGVRSTEIRA
ncbi:MAG: hypothetical protein IH606_08190 [Burkholderiales bacterium]|nr:hypothetical protein [Burkholderiales bacterium]